MKKTEFIQFLKTAAQEKKDVEYFIYEDEDLIEKATVYSDKIERKINYINEHYNNEMQFTNNIRISLRHLKKF